MPHEAVVNALRTPHERRYECATHPPVKQSVSEYFIHAGVSVNASKDAQGTEKLVRPLLLGV